MQQALYESLFFKRPLSVLTQGLAGLALALKNELQEAGFEFKDYEKSLEEVQPALGIQGGKIDFPNVKFPVTSYYGERPRTVMLELKCHCPVVDANGNRKTSNSRDSFLQKGMLKQDLWKAVSSAAGKTGTRSSTSL